MTEAGSELRRLVEEVLEPGERVVDMFPVEAGEVRLDTTPLPPREWEVLVFGAQSWQETSWGSRAFDSVLNFLSPDPPRGEFGDPALREKHLRKKKAFWGAWDSLAGGLLRGLRPRGAAEHKILLLTDRRAQLVYLGHVAVPGGEPVLRSETGWRCAPHELVWVRDCRDRSRGHYQLGFSDGTWAPVYFPRTVRDRFAALFPQAQHWRKPLPDVLADPRWQAQAARAVGGTGEPV
ncbi:hypothetical protein [Streptomyces sp. NPDC003077]|uniref:hypothetical protein n=1 Tax=Streptomyces sp. NPDC003077 TaxID=3154443 RepID=UPI0033B30DAD